MFVVVRRVEDLKLLNLVFVEISRNSNCQSGEPTNIRRFSFPLPFEVCVFVWAFHAAL
jgi:hypothetical protein